MHKLNVTNHGAKQTFTFETLSEAISALRLIMNGPDMDPELDWDIESLDQNEMADIPF